MIRQSILAGIVVILAAVFCAFPSAAADAPAAPPAKAPPAKAPAKAPPPKLRPWLAMDYGAALGVTVESPVPEPTMAQKGILIRLDKSTGAYALFDHDLLRYAAYSTASASGPLDYKGVLFDGSHRTWSSLAGDMVSGTRLTPGWADPASGTFTDPRPRFASVDYKPQPEPWRNRAYGPLPRAWGRYRGMYRHGERVVLSYDIGTTAILDSPSIVKQGEQTFFARTIQIAQSEKDLAILVSEVTDKSARVVSIAQPDSAGSAGAPAAGAMVMTGTAPAGVFHAAIAAPEGAKWEISESAQVRLTIPARATPARLTIVTARFTPAAITSLPDLLRGSPEDLSALTQGGPAHWPEVLHTQGKLEDPALLAKSSAKPAPDGVKAAPTAYVADNLTAPTENPWKARMRFSGIDFFADGRSAAVCTWDGDVWMISNIDASLANLQWRRIASGLNQPLGLRIMRAAPHKGGPAREVITVSCRDQIARLHDLNEDGEADFIECFNSDHQVTEHFHDFVMGLDVDSAGNLYYARAARHALPQVVAQHGTVIRVSADGSKSDIIGTGLRAANGIGISADGRVAVSDQEGFWMPANRINVFKPAPAGSPPPFFGNIWGYTNPVRKAEQGYDPPLCWLPRPLDRSPAEQFWANSKSWGPLSSHLLHTSYGAGRLFLVLDETIDGVPQGGVVAMNPLAFSTGIMRGRFNPADGQLYLCGLIGWSSNTSEPGGLFRVRYTGRPLYLPTSLRVVKGAIQLGFDVPLDKATAQDAGSYAIQQWNYRWSQNYGSKNYKPSDPSKQGEDDVTITSAALSADGRTVTLSIPGLAPVMQMKIELNLKAADGGEIRDTIHSTINKVPG